MAIVAATCYQSRNHGMTKTWKEAFALAAVIQSVFAKDLRKRVARRCAYGGDAEIGTEPLAISLRTLPPLWWSVVVGPCARGSEGGGVGEGGGNFEDFLVVFFFFWGGPVYVKSALRRGR